MPGNCAITGRMLEWPRDRSWWWGALDDFATHVTGFSDGVAACRECRWL